MIEVISLTLTAASPLSPVMTTEADAGAGASSNRADTAKKIVVRRLCIEAARYGIERQYRSGILRSRAAANHRKLKYQVFIFIRDLPFFANYTLVRGYRANEPGALLEMPDEVREG